MTHSLTHSLCHKSIHNTHTLSLTEQIFIRTFFTRIFRRSFTSNARKRDGCNPLSSFCDKSRRFSITWFWLDAIVTGTRNDPVNRITNTKGTNIWCIRWTKPITLTILSFKSYTTTTTSINNNKNYIRSSSTNATLETTKNLLDTGVSFNWFFPFGLAFDFGFFVIFFYILDLVFDHKLCSVDTFDSFKREIKNNNFLIRVDSAQMFPDIFFSHYSLFDNKQKMIEHQFLWLSWTKMIGLRCACDCVTTLATSLNVAESSFK